MRLLDVRHEQTAVFAAEATGKLTRRPGLAVLTAGPGRHQRRQRDRPGAVRRLADGRRRRPGAAEPLGQRQPAGARPAADRSRRSPSCARDRARRRATSPPRCDEAFRLAGTRTAGRSSSTCRWTSSSAAPTVELPAAAGPRAAEPGPRRARRRSPRCSPRPSDPVLVLGTDVWADGAEEAALRLVETAGVPVDHQRDGPRRPARRAPAAGHQGARAAPSGGADLVVVVGTPLDFRLGYGVVRRQGRRARRRGWCTSPTPPASWPAHVELAGSAAGDLEPGPRRAARAAGRGGRAARLVDVGRAACRRRRRSRGRRATRDAARRRRRPDPPGPDLRRAGPAAGRRRRGDRRRRRLRVASPASTSSPSGPAAGSTPGPTAASAPGSAHAIAARLARPSAQVVLLLGDGAAGFSLMDVDTLVRHRPAGRDGGAATTPRWGLEKGPMQMLYGYDVVADLAPRPAYDEVVRALGGAGETVTAPGEIGPALRPRLRRRACRTASTSSPTPSWPTRGTTGASRRAASRPASVAPVGGRGGADADG